MDLQQQTQIVDEVITSRHSVRAFLNTPVPQEIIKDILSVASRAPSGTNTQPWKVYVVTGDKRAQLIDNIFTAKQAIADDPSLADKFQETFPYYPTEWISPFIDRRRENGWGLYGLLGIQKGDKEKMAAQQDRNFKLFDAPVGLFFTVNKVMGTGSKMDIAMMIQNVMIAAKARGLDTCPQAAFNHFHPVVLETIGAGDDEELVCTVALGYADESDIVNTFITPRVPVDEFAVFLD
ncbi:nitroreductase [Moraxella sp. FZFQ2102]|uniref:nitroreductase n=1 Tax=Moraxella sp. FZFQ2102 TaxID=2953752 RepID=UPI00209BDFDC|nr:nitroreductase [Moraxella sp. FZFQ2102]USZ15459.1 nitroreductase [Moraxella sp. FZFQ2102]